VNGHSLTHGRATNRLIALAIAASIALSGCAWTGNRWSPRNIFSARPKCVLPDDPTAAEVVSHLNAKTENLYAWRAHSATIKTRGRDFLLPSIDASVAVEAPRNFRLIAGTPGSQEVDIGSNADEFWFWAKRNNDQKVVLAARHEEIDRAQRRLPFPFEPDWVMEVLGVVPLDAADLSVEPGPPRSHRVRLISDRTTPRGQRLRKISVVDTCSGHIVEHALYDPAGRLIARATPSGYVTDRTTGITLPARFDFDWPQAGSGFTLTLRDWELNPKRLPDGLWALPNMPGYDVIDLGK
jgi:hypothetical protein